MNYTNSPADQSAVTSSKGQPAPSPAATSNLSTERILQALVENSFDLAGLIDEQFQYRYISDSVNQIFNSKADALFGFAADRLLGKNCLELVHPHDQPRLAAQLANLLQTGKKIYLRPYRIKDSAGHWHWLEAIVTNQLANPAIQAIVISARDVTQQVVAEQKLRDLQRLEALVAGEEKERSRIARDLHDEIAGMIAAAKLQFGALGKKTTTLSVEKEFQQGMALLENAARQVRRTSHNLMPEILLENGLAEALQRYCAAVSHEGLPVLFGSLGEQGRLPPLFELSLYRMAQEAVNNLLKHSGATQAMVQLSRHGTTLSLTIEDNGKGFDPTMVPEGTGITSLRNRAAAMQGHAEIRSAPGQGTTVYLEVTVTNTANSDSST